MSMTWKIHLSLEIKMAFFFYGLKKKSRHFLKTFKKKKLLQLFNP